MTSDQLHAIRSHFLRNLDLDDVTTTDDLRELLEKCREHGWARECDICGTTSIPEGEWVEDDRCLCSGCATDWHMYGPQILDPSID